MRIESILIESSLRRIAMYSPTTRLLTVLEMLQSNRSIGGPELAARLEVDVRSVRRYITLLRDMGIPVESEPGRYGTYYLRPGFRLPPLMFNNAEIMAIFLGLMAVRHIGLAGTPGIESAAAKIERVLPDELRQRIRALQGVLSLDIPAYETPLAAETIARFSLAAYQRNQLWIEYVGARGEPTERTIDVYGLVYHVGFWYAVAYCHLRQDLRVFRLDRARQTRLLETNFEPAVQLNPLTYLLESFASMPGAWEVEVLLRLPGDQARALIPREMAFIEDTPDGVVMRCYSEGLDWIAHFLINLRCPVVVRQPPELRETLRRIAAEVLRMAENTA
jgi:predicted DNA-binding transcriptional regulator YafY